MNQEIDRKLMPEFLQTTLSMSLGAAYCGLEMLRHPSKTMTTMVTEAQNLFTMPDDAGNGVEDKMKALAAVWLEKAATLMSDCKTTGERFSEGK
jgi:hypothetical protein